MNQTGLFDYLLEEAPEKLQSTRKDNIAIVPASLLFHSSKVKEAKNRLPTGSVLLCPSTQEKMRRTLSSVATYFRNHGHQVQITPASQL